MTDKVKIKGEKMVRDMNTGAVLSTDHEAIDEYERKRLAAEARKVDINNMKRDIEEIKSLLRSMMDNRN